MTVHLFSWGEIQNEPIINEFRVHSLCAPFQSHALFMYVSVFVVAERDFGLEIKFIRWLVLLLFKKSDAKFIPVCRDKEMVVILFFSSWKRLHCLPQNGQRQKKKSDQMADEAVSIVLRYPRLSQMNRTANTITN